MKRSPAFDNDLSTGDIIRKINNIEVADASHFLNLLAENNGQQIELEVFRNDKTIVKTIKLN